MTRRNNRGAINLLGVFLGIFFCLWLGTFALAFAGCTAGGLLTVDPNDSTISDGTRVGVVNKFSTKGLVGWTKTWEGDLLVGGAGTVQQSHWRFTVDSNDEKMVKAVNDAMESQMKVELKYHKYLWIWKFSGETTYFITACKPTGSAQPTPPTSGAN